MRKLLFPTLFLIACVSMAVAQTEAVPESVSTLVRLIGWVCTLLMAWVSVPITNWLKNIPYVQGEVVIVVNVVVNFIVIYLLDLLFKVGIWDNPGFMNYAIQALGVNQTVASFIFEYLKRSKAATA